MSDPGLPLKTGEGKTMTDTRTSGEVDVLHRMVEAAEQHASHWEAECGRLREQLNTRQWWLDMQYLLADRNRLREQLDVARQALEALWDAAEPYATYRDGDLNAALHATRAALGVEINDGKDEDDEQG
jgi:hypothetical protein